MLTNQASTTGLDDRTSWTALYERTGVEPNDYVSEVRSAVEYGLHDPEDSVGMACAAAETADASVQALLSPWSLYTPQDAAVVASALFVQLRHGADALAELARSASRIVERGEAELPAPAGPGKPANLADALVALRTVSDAVHSLVDGHASTTVSALHAAPGTAPLPGDAHESVVAVAALLAEQHDRTVTLNQRHRDGAFEVANDGFGCGCSVTIAGDSEEYDFNRGDSEWSLFRESDGQKQPDGSTVFSTWKTLSTTSLNAHPQQLVDDILRVIAADQ
ncbi:hypothetical protein [Streptomyces sp. NRRL S-1868]|uniref:hypothetical protein n=1 Tax=Streptomyces sp. NRRL S-1868 TaxID=1463892 RepID=UPI000691297D|nr:hypothetical protein [Streptomyces sp. NRRL S-1868]